MDLRSSVKQALRMGGHAVVSTVHDRLNGIEQALQDILEQNTHIAATQTALLQSGLHVVERLARMQKQLQETEARLEQQSTMPSDIQDVAAAVRQLQEALAAKTCTQAQLLEGMAGIHHELRGLEARIRGLIPPSDNSSVAAVQVGVDRMIGLSENIGHTAAASLALLEPAARQTADFLANESVRQVSVETSDYAAANPEMGLAAFLYSHLPSRRVLDIGAHVGDVAEYLLDAGYEVFSFEPYAQSYRRLIDRLGQRPGFHPFRLALGSASGELPLYLVDDLSTEKHYGDPTVFHSLARHGMPADLPFRGSVAVTVKRLAELHASGEVPADIGLVKIDTEGFDLEVVRGMLDYRYPVVIAEFWDIGIPFGSTGLLYTLESMVGEMRARGYLWYIVIYRVWGRPQTAFYCNHERPVPHSWGNVAFFRDRETFAEAQSWCSATLPRTYFKFAPVESSAR